MKIIFALALLLAAVILLDRPPAPPIHAASMPSLPVVTIPPTADEHEAVSTPAVIETPAPQFVAIELAPPQVPQPAVACGPNGCGPANSGVRYVRRFRIFGRRR